MTYEMPTLGRVLRQNFYTPVTLLLFASLIALATQQASKSIIRIAWGALLGFAASALWLTREESVWAIPSVSLLIGGAVWTAFRSGSWFRTIVVQLGTATLCGGLVMASVCSLNLHFYGWFGTVEFRSPAFISAYGALQRIVSSHEVSFYVPVTREAREKAYTISPAFAELRPYLEGDIGTAWAINSAQWIGLPPEAKEIGGGWFMWALRDSVIASGHAPNARSALEFYGRIASEVNHACDLGLVPCRGRYDTMMPPWRQVHTQRLMKAMPEAFANFFTFRDFDPFPPPSAGSASLLQLFHDMTRWSIAPSAECPEQDRPEQEHFDHFRLVVLWVIGNSFRIVGSAAALGAVAIWLWTLVNVLRLRSFSYPILVATAALGGAAAVVIVNTLVDVLSFPNRSVGAYAQGYPLLLLFAALTWIEFAAAQALRFHAVAAKTSDQVR
jgi:hypothetical protein